HSIDRCARKVSLHPTEGRSQLRVHCVRVCAGTARQIREQVVALLASSRKCTGRVRSVGGEAEIDHSITGFDESAVEQPRLRTRVPVRIADCYPTFDRKLSTNPLNTVARWK